MNEFESRNLRDCPPLGERIDVCACRLFATRNIDQDITVNQVRHLSVVEEALSPEDHGEDC
ncbi:MAG: hypothetical protein DMG24_09290 [Acidobacteria bacterium]|nr:MAG: hypothetical protein DMG24_09290 [Acidobacteriota bacterium]